MNNNIIQKVAARDSVEIHLDNKLVLSGPRNALLSEFISVVESDYDSLVVGAIVNNELKELTFPVEIDSYVKPITMSDADGARIYRRSLTFLLEAAFKSLFPENKLAISHSVASGGYFCEVVGGRVLTDLELESLQEKMLDYVSSDVPFVRKEVPIDEAINYFEINKEYHKVRLLQYRKKDHLVLYELNGYRDYHHGYMVPSTGYLKWFGLLVLDNGFVLRYPRRHAPNKLLPLQKSKKLIATFQQYGNWLTKLGIESVGYLNDAVEVGKIREVVLVSEALHEQKIAEIAKLIIDKHKHTRIILIAGPSSSGKTTFSKRLSVQLLSHGISPFALELDNYFVDREKTPLDENGEYDYESIGALSTNLLVADLQQLINGEEVQLPKYNFKKGKREIGDIVRLSNDQIIILEGIHGLNPKLLPEIDPDKAFRLYVSCLTQLNLDRHNRISTTDTRLIRRIVRDARERGYSAQSTISRWESVRRGEKRNIFPFQENADGIFNTALVYELSSLKSLAEPLLRQVPYSTKEYIEAKRLLRFLEWFLPIDNQLIPDNSLIREFIGGSILSDFKLWS